VYYKTGLGLWLELVLTDTSGVSRVLYTFSSAGEVPII